MSLASLKQAAPAPEAPIVVADIELRQIPNVRGDRAIWIRAELWGFWIMEGHGCHGPSYTLFDKDRDVVEDQSKKFGRKIVIDSVKTRSRRRFGVVDDGVTTQDLMRSAVVDAIERKILRSPAELEAEAKLQRAAADRVRAAEQAKADRIRAFLKWAGKLAIDQDLPDMLKGPQDCYADIFCVPMAPID